MWTYVLLGIRVLRGMGCGYSVGGVELRRILGMVSGFSGYLGWVIHAVDAIYAGDSGDS